MATKPAVTPIATGIAVRTLIVLILVNIINFYDRHVAGALAEPLRHEFGLTDSQIGLISTVFTILYAIVGIPIGRLADTGSRKKLLAVGIVVWGCVTGMAAWARSLAMLVASRLGLAVGEAVCAPVATSWIGDLFAPNRRSRPLALFMLGVPVGGALSFFFSGPIAQRFGWRPAMIVAAIPALLLAPVVLMLPEPLRGASETSSATTQRPSRSGLLTPTFAWIIASGVLVNFNLYALGTFLPAFFQRVHHLKVGSAGISTGLVYAIGGILGGTIGGAWGDRLVRRHANGRMLLAAYAAVISAPLAYLGIRQGFGALAIAVPLLTAAYGLLNMYYGLVYASLQDIVAPAQRATAMAVYFLVMYLGGASFGPVITGRLSDFMAHRAAGALPITEAFKAIGLQQAMQVVPVLAVGLGIVLWAGSRTIERDAQRQRATVSTAA
ncbi:MAG TPA: MFS transporter [Candidatus Limnocylindrales bacterium]|nr:MFS transporter [Candidatus Limnocylindrales bacterium]